MENRNQVESKRKNSMEGNWYILLHGLSLESTPMLLVPGLSLRQIESDLSVFDLAAAGSVGFREWALLEPLAGECKCELASAQDAATIPGFDALNRAWLISNMLNLLGHSFHSALACSRYSWNIIAGIQERSSGQIREQIREEGIQSALDSPKCQLPRFRGELLDYHIVKLVHGDRRRDPVSQQDVAWITTHFDKFNTLSSESTQFLYALTAASDWRYSKDARAAIARLWSGVESLFDIKTELVYRLSISAASLLTSRGDARIEKFKAIKKLYGLRSKAVHGSPLTSQEVQTTMDESFHLLRELILATVVKGKIFSKEDIEKSLFC